jgi:hypothetical protein
MRDARTRIMPSPSVEVQSLAMEEVELRLPGVAGGWMLTLLTGSRDLNSVSSGFPLIPTVQVRNPDSHRICSTGRVHPRSAGPSVEG